MAHELDFSTGTAAIAYAGGTEKPWHGFGNILLPGDTPEEQARKAGLAWSVIKADVKYTAQRVGVNPATGQFGVFDEERNASGRSVLYRSDTGADLSIMSTKRYHIVQPADILNFFSELAEAGGFKLNVAGALQGGKKIWATASVERGANIIGADHVRPYLLFFTSFDGSAATTVKFVEERVVCANTLAIAADETIETNLFTGTASGIKFNHNKKFDPAKVKDQLGIIHEAHDLFVERAQELVAKTISDVQAEELIAKIITRGKSETMPPADVKAVQETRGYKKMIALFNGVGLIGGGVDGGKNAWRLLNATTQLVDHERGKNRESGLHSAWFGEGAKMKTEAFDLLLAL